MDATLEFVGTATTLLRLGPFTLLTDPNFIRRGQRVYLGKGLFTRRLTEPALQPGLLPELDAGLLSHLHGDHFDRVARDELDRGLPILTTPPASRKLSSWGFGEALGMANWETVSLSSGRQRLSVTAAPGQHAPGPARHLVPPVIGLVGELDDGLGGPPFRLYITGDTLYRPWLRQVAERAGPLDAMVIHLGGTRALGLLVTMDGAQGAELTELLAPAVTVPVHYDDYTAFKSPLEDFLRACEKRQVPTRLQPVGRGEQASLTPPAQ